tara:strand:+ start:72 stop:194 length:123 start_codon:yes stop_codon:yes gene_type:complete
MTEQEIKEWKAWAAGTVNADDIITIVAYPNVITLPKTSAK